MKEEFILTAAYFCRFLLKSIHLRMYIFEFICMFRYLGTSYDDDISRQSTKPDPVQDSEKYVNKRFNITRADLFRIEIIEAVYVV